jgi:hypothetical protein
MIAVSQVNIWQAAAQMVKVFDIDASMEAALRSDAALDQGDMDNHLLWLKVTNAIIELQRTKRVDGEGLN